MGCDVEIAFNGDPACACKLKKWPHAEPKSLCYLKPYSTDISAAWEVVEKLLANRQDFTIDSFMRLGKVTHSVRFDDSNLTYGDSAPHAICLAALKAVGHDLT